MEENIEIVIFADATVLHVGQLGRILSALW